MTARRALQQCLLCDLELPGAPAFPFERLGQLLDDGRRELGRDDAASGRGFPHGVQDLVAVRILQDVAGGARHQHVPDRALVLQAGQRHDPDVGVQLLEPPGRLDPVHRGHPDVHEHHVGSGRDEELQGLGPVARLAHDHELVGVQERDQRVAEPRVVVYHEHADTLARGRRSPLHQHVTSVT